MIAKANKAQRSVIAAALKKLPAETKRVEVNTIGKTVIIRFSRKYSSLLQSQVQ